MSEYSLPQLIEPKVWPRAVFPDRMVWTSSSLRMFRKCKRKFFWKYIMRMRSKYLDKNLTIGSRFHQCLAEWYRQRRTSMEHIVGKHQKELQQLLFSDEVTSLDQQTYDKFRCAVEAFSGMMCGYETMYSQDRKDWAIDRQSIEQQFIVDCGEFDYAGKIDFVASPKGKKETFLIEHKTASRIREQYLERLPLDTQIRGYLFGAIKGLGYKVNKVLYDVVQKSRLRRKGDESIAQFGSRVADAYEEQSHAYFHREPAMFAKSDLEAFEFELRQTNQEYNIIRKDLAFGNGEFADDIKTMLREQPELNPRNPRAWTPNDATCDEYFRVCEYLRLCTSGVDEGTAQMYSLNESMHEELVEETED